MRAFPWPERIGRLLRIGLLVLVGMTHSIARAEVHIRWNQAGYPPERSKVLVVMSDRDLTSESWEVRQGSSVVLSGEFSTRTIGEGPHTPLPFNHTADVSALRKPGDYVFVAPEASPANLRVVEDPYARFIAQALQHLRMVRSGTTDVPTGRRISHLGDARAPVWIVDGDPREGRWKPAERARTVDVQGGWYDAGDQIKFTLNEAYTTYVLLLAYRWNPALFATADGANALPAVVLEARHGLRYLARLYPDDDTFVIQVGDERDHNQAPRLPENDPLDGQRPALCALSRVHLASTAAALAAGAHTFRTLGEESETRNWADLARRLYARARQPDTIASAFERGHVNDFYHDPSDEDQLALAAAELFRLTGEQQYLEQAKAYAPPAASEVSWMTWHGHANAALAPYDPAAFARLRQETERYVAHARELGQPWQVPGRLVWASLHRWIGAAHTAKRVALLSGAEAGEGHTALFDGMIDYTFGHNPWGVSFVFSRDLPNTVRHIYAPMYHLLDQFPTGALSEGPGSRATHDGLSRYFESGRAERNLPWRPELARFNTEAAVFSDDAANFMTQEATIGGQADLVLLLALASAESVGGESP